MHGYFRVVLPAKVGAVAGVVQIAMSHDDEPEVSRPASRLVQFPLKAGTVAGKPRVDQDIARAGPHEVAVDSAQPDTGQAHGEFNGPDACCFLIPLRISGGVGGLPPGRGRRHATALARAEVNREPDGMQGEQRGDRRTPQVVRSACPR